MLSPTAAAGVIALKKHTFLILGFDIILYLYRIL